ncbi:hypothetical protein RRG08_011651 [Elysia crispata]|uniref:Uncharacterized protein n=1 Tax=Elysia crispata TaxID=231223 RepID=A0AAE0YL75_9GAST|nr:hypothetical protein RRG08_011651 [Elysia crispata]
MDRSLDAKMSSLSVCARRTTAWGYRNTKSAKPRIVSRNPLELATSCPDTREADNQPGNSGQPSAVFIVISPSLGLRDVTLSCFRVHIQPRKKFLGRPLAPLLCRRSPLIGRMRPADERDVTRKAEL